jgi:hypothetical protein
MLKPCRFAGAAALIGLAFGSDPLAAECRWLVQPYVSEATLDRPTFDILYDGLERRVFYAFSVVSEGIAERIAGEGALPEAVDDLRPLEALQTPLDHTVYRLDLASVSPGTLYLVAAPEPVPALERAGARIVPERPLMVSQYVPRTRGASDQSGALPRRSEATVLADAEDIAASDDLVICAYDAAIR